MTFTDFILSRRSKDKGPRKDFIADVQDLIRQNLFPDPWVWADLYGWMWQRYPDYGVRAAGRKLWREYRHAETGRPNIYCPVPPTDRSLSLMYRQRMVELERSARHR